jgi:hypothetical protein
MNINKLSTRIGSLTQELQELLLKSCNTDTDQELLLKEIYRIDRELTMLRAVRRGVFTWMVFNL